MDSEFSQERIFWMTHTNLLVSHYICLEIELHVIVIAVHYFYHRLLEWEMNEKRAQYKSAIHI